MSDRTESLRRIFLEVSDDDTVTESQRRERSHEPIDADEEGPKPADSVRDGLDDAIDGLDDVDG